MEMEISERKNRTQNGPDGIERPMESENPSFVFGTGFVREKRVPRSGSYAFSQAVQCPRDKDPRREGREGKQGLGNSTESVPELYERETCAGRVAQIPEVSFAQSRGRFGDALKHSYEHDGESDGFEVYGHDRIEHLARYVREQAHEGEYPDGSRDMFHGAEYGKNREDPTL